MLLLLLQQPGRNLDGTCLPVDGHRLASAVAALALAVALAAVVAFSILSGVVFDVAAISSIWTFSASTLAHTLKIYKEGEGGGGMHSIEVNKSYFISAPSHRHAHTHAHTHTRARTHTLSPYFYLMLTKTLL